MAFCVVWGVCLGDSGDHGNPVEEDVFLQATLQTDVTQALGKGRTLAGDFTSLNAGGLPTAPGQLLAGLRVPFVGLVGVQPMLCPKAMVGTTPAKHSTKPGSDGNVGKCVVNG